MARGKGIGALDPEGLIFGFAGAAFRQGIPTLEAFNMFQGLGFNVIPTEFYRIYQLAVDAHDAAGYINTLEPTHLPDPDRIPEAITTLRRQYSYTFRINTLESDLGEKKPSFFTVSTDNLLDTDSARMEAQKMFDRRYNSKFTTMTSIELDQILKAGPGGRL